LILAQAAIPIQQHPIPAENPAQQIQPQIPAQQPPVQNAQQRRIQERLGPMRHRLPSIRERLGPIPPRKYTFHSFQY
jgi:hypothetical protein